MRKFTILFAMLLAMSGMSFGQKEPKLLWKKRLPNSDDSLRQWTFAEPSSVVRISPKGNILSLSSPGLAAVYSKEGKLLWREDEIAEKIYMNINGKNINWIWTKDSLLLIDNDYEFTSKIVLEKKQDLDPNVLYSLAFEVEDGIIISTDIAINKYNFKGEKQWSYKNNKLRYFKFTSNQEPKKAPYPFIIQTKSEGDYSTLILTKNGEKMIESESKLEPFVYPTTDNGFWLRSRIPASGQNKGVPKDSLFARYDSTGKQLVIIKYENLLPKSYLPVVSYSDASIFFDDKSIIFPYVSPNKGELFFSKTDLQGNTRLASKKITSFLSNTFIDVKIESDGNTFKFYLVDIDSNNVTSNKIGTGKFDDNSFGFVREVRAENGLSIYNDGKYLVFARGDSSLSTHNFDGNLKWSIKGITDISYNLTGDYRYIQQTVNNEVSTSKISIIDGSIIWKENRAIPINDIYEDTDSNSYFINFSLGVQKFTLQRLPTSPSNKINLSANILMNTKWNRFAINLKNGFLCFSTTEGQRFFTLYTYSIRCLFDLQPKIQTVSRTGVCSSETVKLSTDKQEGVTYQWQKDGKDIPNFKDVVHDIGESGTYTVVVKDEICQNQATSNSLKINIRSLPTAEIKALKTTFCEGEKTTIAATTNGTFFQWQKDGKDIPNATSDIYEVSQAGDYRVGVRDDKCPQVGYSNIYTIITKLLPEANISMDIKGVVYEPFTVKMTANSGTGLAYQWLKDDVIIPNEIKLTYEAKKSGKYNVNVMSDGCMKISNALTINILIPLSNQAEIGEETIQVYPNPSKGAFKIILPKTLKSAEVQLFDTFGRERNLTYTGEQAQADGLVQGTYFLRVQKGEKSVVNKIVIE